MPASFTPAVSAAAGPLADSFWSALSTFNGFQPDFHLRCPLKTKKTAFSLLFRSFVFGLSLTVLSLALTDRPAGRIKARRTLSPSAAFRVQAAFGAVIPAPASAVSASDGPEPGCPGACRTGLDKMTAEKNKTQKRREASEPWKEAGRTAMKTCLSAVYSQIRPVLGFPNLPDLVGALEEICRRRGSPPQLPGFSLPQAVPGGN
jgi:hypothetical protein